MKFSYKQRLFFYFFLIFSVFTICVIWFEQSEEKKQRTENLKERLSNYADMLHAYIEQHTLSTDQFSQLQVFSNVMPMDIRITILDPQGKVIFDKHGDTMAQFDNHLERPEIKTAAYKGVGSNIRKSASTGEKYLYYAKNYENYYIRMALPYTVDNVHRFSADEYFVYIVIVLSAVVLLLLYYVAGQFGQSVSHLRNLAVAIKEGRPITDKYTFPNDEVGEIGNELVEILAQKERSKQDVESAREKMVQHFHYAQEGIAIFDKQNKVIYANTNFYKFINVILDRPTFELKEVIKDPIFEPAMEFVENISSNEDYHTYTIKNSGRFFTIQTIVFEDGSFELLIKDVTKVEKNRLLKQEITSNIAHELRTPVTSLRGYLETLVEQPLPKEKVTQFLERAYQQSLRLSVLIDDISLISKIEEAPSQFAIEGINLNQLVNYVRIDLADKIAEHDIHIHISVREDLVVQGNYTLLYSIFRNLIDNSIHHGGDHIRIDINNYSEDSDYVFFSYFDTGKGVEEQYLPRLFERFYRVNEGRTRDDGGSGLGLSIVRNAVLFHKGEIQVKNRLGGGLAFFFTLKKKL